MAMTICSHTRTSPNHKSRRKHQRIPLAIPYHRKVNRSLVNLKSASHTLQVFFHRVTFFIQTEASHGGVQQKSFAENICKIIRETPPIETFVFGKVVGRLPTLLKKELRYTRFRMNFEKSFRKTIL